MNQAVKGHLPVIVVTTIIGFLTGALLLTLVHDNATTMSANTFSLAIFLIPCFIMLLGSAIIAATSSEIGRQLYAVVLMISLVTGCIAMVVTSTWLDDPTITTAVLANSPEGTVMAPILKSPITMIRDIAAFVVVPTVGCIFGAWLGSRLHPMKGEKPKKKSGRKR